MSNRQKNAEKETEANRAARGMLRVLESINPDLDLKQTLFRLVDVTIEVTGAERSAILLLSGGRLAPAAVSARKPNRHLFRRFREMEPISLEEVAGRPEVLSGGEVVVIDDVKHSPLVPPGWAEVLGSRSAAVVPLIKAGNALGLLAVDYQEVHDFDEVEVNLLKAVGQAARIALESAELRRREARKDSVGQKVLAGVSTVASGGNLDDTLRKVASALESLFEGSACSITLSDGDQAVCFGLPASGGKESVFPMRIGDTRYGHLTLKTLVDLSEEDMTLAEAFAQQAALAIDRARLSADAGANAASAQAAAKISRLIGDGGNLGKLLPKLNDEVCRAAGFECLEVATRSPGLAKLVGCRTLEKDELSLADRLASEAQWGLQLLDSSGVHAVILDETSQISGLLFVRSVEGGLEEERQAVVRAVAAWIAENARLALLRRSLTRAESHKQNADARNRLSKRLEHTLDRSLALLAGSLTKALAREPDDAELTSQLQKMRTVVSQALMEGQALGREEGLLELRAEGLHAALRGLVKSVGDDAGIDATFRVQGEPTSLAPLVQESFYAIAFDTLTILQTAGHPTAIAVKLDYDYPIRLSLRDDGVGLGQREMGLAPGIHYAIGTTRELAERIGASIAIEHAAPRGLSIIVSLPLPDNEGRDRLPVPADADLNISPAAEISFQSSQN